MRKRMRQLVRPIYERRWGSADMVWNSTQRLLRREDAVAERDTYKALSSAKREEIADALFNQAYSCLMAVAGEGGAERTRAVLRQNPRLANSLWCACRIRWHAQLKVPLAEIRKLMRSLHAVAELPRGETQLGEARPANSEGGAGTDSDNRDHNAETGELTENYLDKEETKEMAGEAEIHHDRPPGTRQGATVKREESVEDAARRLRGGRQQC